MVLLLFQRGGIRGGGHRHQRAQRELALVSLLAPPSQPFCFPAELGMYNIDIAARYVELPRALDGTTF